MSASRFFGSILAVSLTCAPLGCAMLRPDRGPSDAETAAKARDQAAALARQRALEAEITRLGGEIALRDAIASAISAEQARTARALEESNVRGTELAERLRTAGAMVERLATERRELLVALADARARLEPRDGAAPPAPPPSAPAPEGPKPDAPRPDAAPSPPPDPGASAPVAIIQD